MTYRPDRHHRRSIRLRGYDYSQAGAYFVTICAKDRACLFGEVVDGAMVLNPTGRIVQATWAELPSHYQGVHIDEFVVMPNHVHGIVVLSERDDGNQRDVGAQFIAPQTIAPQTIAPQTIAPPMGTGTTLPGAPTKGAINRAPTLGDVVRGFKARITNAINGVRQTPGVPVWQRNYYEYIIRDDDDLNRIRQYIIDNTAQWAFDRENPAVVDAEAVMSRAGVAS